MTSLWRHSRLTYYDLGPNVLTQGVELLAGEVWQVSKRNSQYFRSYLRKTTEGGPFGPPPSGARVKCCNRLWLRAGVGVDKNSPAPTPTPTPAKLPTPADSDSDSDFAALQKSLTNAVWSVLTRDRNERRAMKCPLRPEVPETMPVWVTNHIRYYILNIG